MQKPDDVAQKLLGMPYDALDERTQKVARHIAGRKHIATNTAHQIDATPGQRAADAVAHFGGSWIFIGLFASIMVIWVTLNSIIY